MTQENCFGNYNGKDECDNCPVRFSCNREKSRRNGLDEID